MVSLSKLEVEGGFFEGVDDVFLTNPLFFCRCVWHFMSGCSRGLRPPLPRPSSIHPSFIRAVSLVIRGLVNRARETSARAALVD